ncbi:MAG: hypothetical protein ACJ0K4_05825 [Verrucomicrobiales bacterium]|nr:MAG: hypothetical protein EVB09_04545 [Verrucomicrobiaceae bacterium]
MLFSYKHYRNNPLLQKSFGFIYLPPLFWWSILIVTLAAIAILSWTFSTYVFDHPNKKIPYKILTKLNKISPIEKFSPQDPPKAKKGFSTARSLMEEEFSNFTGVYLSYLNDILLRDYIENYKRTEGVYYLKGTFTVTHSRKLTDSDLFTSGTVLSANCDDFPKASIELVLPLTPPSPDPSIRLGTKFSIENDNFLCLLHIRKPSEDTVCFTLLPITYEDLLISKTESIKTAPPKSLNIDGNWPLINDSDLRPKAVQKRTS